MRLNLSGTTSDSDLCSSQIFRNFWPPPFQYPAYATDKQYATMSKFFEFKGGKLSSQFRWFTIAKIEL